MAASQDDSDIEEISDPSWKKGKANATEDDEDDDQDRAPPARKNGKRKATSDDDDDIQVVEQPKRQKTKTGRARSEIREATRTRTKPSSSRATSKQPPIASSPSEERDDNGGEGADVALQNPKKRKINIFPTGNDAIQFSFGGMSSVCFYFSTFISFFSDIWMDSLMAIS